MSKKHLYAVFSLFLSLGIVFSCENDNYEAPKLVPKTYNFNIPNKVSFNFSQLSENRESVIPYSNTLKIKNISNDNISGEYAVFAFKEMFLNFDNISFIKHGDFSEVLTNTSTDSIILEQSNNLFASENLIASILTFNDGNDHEFNGFYNGELNVFIPTETDTTFQRSITCVGTVDYQGKFDFYIQDEDDIARLKGNFNSDNLISGNILNRSAANLSSIINSQAETLELLGTNLKGYVNFTENNTEARILKFNLTKQN
nr:hypothetical protein [uncultured Psychroserpens sp.]